MALPPKGHPDRPLRLAARSMLILGGLLTLLTPFAGLLSLLSIILPHMIPGMGWVVAVALLLYTVTGWGFILGGVYLKRYRRWAAVVGIALTSLLLLGLLMLLGILVIMVGAAASRSHWLIALFLLMLAAGFTQLLAYLFQSFEAIRLNQGRWPRGHGFQPIMAEPNSG